VITTELKAITAKMVVKRQNGSDKEGIRRLTTFGGGKIVVSPGLPGADSPPYAAPSIRSRFGFLMTQVVHVLCTSSPIIAGPFNCFNAETMQNKYLGDKFSIFYSICLKQCGGCTGWQQSSLSRLIWCPLRLSISENCLPISPAIKISVKKINISPFVVKIGLFSLVYSI